MRQSAREIERLDVQERARATDEFRSSEEIPRMLIARIVRETARCVECLGHHPDCTYFTNSATWAYCDPDLDRFGIADDAGFVAPNVTGAVHGRHIRNWMATTFTARRGGHRCDKCLKGSHTST
jgi:hypothetical protein